MTSTIQPTKQTITVQGSAEIITDFMEYSINMILYNRELYHEEDFEKVEKYGRPYYLTTNYKLKTYLENVLKGLKDLVANDQCHRIDLVIISVERDETIERWEFEIEAIAGEENKENNNGCAASGKQLEELRDWSKFRKATKELASIQNQMNRIVRQIISTVSLLPNYDEELSFNILLHTKKNAHVSLNLDDFQDTDKKTATIDGEGENESGEVQILKFDSLKTGVHTVHSKVCYKVREEF